MKTLKYIVCFILQVGIHVAFFVAMNGDGTTAASSVIKFDLVSYDSSSAYSTSTGVYTCPVHGIYSFHVSILNVGSSFFHIKLMKVNEQLFYFYIGPKQNNYHSTSGSAIVECRVGEAVRVMTSEAGNVCGSKESMFTGFLLHKL
eukprot:GHVT01098926.1.p1 GENE.GHVT01098926.1~~GHVT01098926.1.p1  ORF type:complete len:145 (+),score=8.40 GHVT01098926.1:280-714(+)